MRGSCALVAFLLTAGIPVAARAAPPAVDDQLLWDDEHPRFRPVEYAVTGAAGAAAIAMYTWLPAQKQAHWVGGVLFDDAVRDAVRVRSPGALQAVWTASDVLDVSLIVLTVGVDSLAVPLLRGGGDVALQLGLMDAESFALGSVLSIGLYDTVGRARPPYDDCQRTPSGPGCSMSLTASFPSGHTAEAFVAAGASCANHAYVPLYGSRLLDTLACVRDLTLATADGALRVMGDRHYATDVLAGAGIGFAFGYGLPTLLHYRPARAPGSVTWTLGPWVGPQLGAVAVGSF